MSKTTALNIILGVLVAGLLATLVYQETSDAEPVVTTTTTSTTTTVAETTTTTTTTSTTTIPETTSTSSTTAVPTTLVAPTERFFTGVLVVNGTSAGERIPPVVARLNDAGYIDVRGVVGAVPAQQTTLYYLEEFIGEAQVVAQDLGFELTDVSILPASEAPPVPGIGVAKVIVYLGPGDLPELAPLPEEQAPES
ncbi:MAG: hypothetical protein AB8G14_07215 [Ilumatobacter sp.]